MQNKTYLGDSVYLEVKGAFEIILTTDNGDGASNEIVLEYSMIESMQAFVNACLNVKSEQPLNKE
jgi:hypothetical protein